MTILRYLYPSKQYEDFEDKVRENVSPFGQTRRKFIIPCKEEKKSSYNLRHYENLAVTASRSWIAKFFVRKQRQNYIL